MTTLIPSSLDLVEFEVATFTVIDGVGGSVRNSDQSTSVIWDPGVDLSAGQSLPVTRNPHMFNVRALKAGQCTLSFSSALRSNGGVITVKPNLFAFMPQAITVNVKGRRVTRKYTPGIKHDHKPCGKWAQIRDRGDKWESGSSVVLSGLLVKYSKPRDFVNAAIALDFNNKPIAKDHLKWYLDVGAGKDYYEDGVITSWIKEDPGIRQKLRSLLNESKQPFGKRAGFFEFEQVNYQNIDYQYAFGAIDRVDYEFDFDRKTVSVWFQDCYEWHPVYKGFYDLKDGDDARPTNPLHAAFVELKLEGARDFWMKGEATVPIDWIATAKSDEGAARAGEGQEGRAEDPL